MKWWSVEKYKDALGASRKVPKCSLEHYAVWRITLAVSGKIHIRVVTVSKELHRYSGS